MNVPRDIELLQCATEVVAAGLEGRHLGLAATLPVFKAAADYLEQQLVSHTAMQERQAVDKPKGMAGMHGD